MQLRSGNVREILSMSEKTFKHLIGKKMGGKGRGYHLHFSFMQLMGVAVAYQLRKSERGCSLAYAHRIINAFGLATEKELEKQFSIGFIYFEGVGNTAVLTCQKRPYRSVNLQTLYKHLNYKIKEIESELNGQTAAGRRRGLNSVTTV